MSWFGHDGELRSRAISHLKPSASLLILVFKKPMFENRASDYNSPELSSQRNGCFPRISGLHAPQISLFYPFRAYDCESYTN
jgi:hypothetical protein